MSSNKWKTSSHVEPVEYPFLTQVASPRAHHKLDLIFVHGLNPFGRDDHPTQTWTHENGAFWPRDFLPEDLPYARIFVFGYNSNVTKANTMSTAGIVDHAETLLNLLDMERSTQQLGHALSKIIFVGHSLGGLVIKQALVMAHQNPMYTAIRNATFGLVFFGCPHHGAKNIELGKIAAGVAKFVSEGRANNDLLESLEHNSLFTRDVSQQFRHQLEDYHVVSFIEGMPMQLGGHGPMSVSKIVVEKESAVLGLSGAREVQVVVGADHSAMCKIKERSSRYTQIQGNIRRLAEKAVTPIEGFVPPPTHTASSTRSFPSPPPLPMRPSSNMNSYYGAPPQTGTVIKVTGFLYYPTGTDTKSIRLAELKNTGHWNQAQPLEYEIFQEKSRTLGPDNLATLTIGYDLACTYLELGLYKEATEWAGWVANTTNSTLNQEHALLALKVRSLQGEILENQGDHSGCEIACAAVLTNQQDFLGEDSLDTLETQRRLAEACNSLGRRDEAISRLSNRVQSLQRMLGDTHILSLVAKLQLIEASTNHHLGNQFGTAHLDKDVQDAAKLVQELYKKLEGSFGPKHPVSIKALFLSGRIKLYQGQSTEATDTLRRVLSYAEEILGIDHPLTIDIVIVIGVKYMRSQGLSFTTNGPPEMRPWFQRALDWIDKRKGPNSEDARQILDILATSYMSAKDYTKAQQYFERLSIAYGDDDSTGARTANQMLQLCQMTTMYTKQNSNSLASVFSRFGRQ